MTFTEIVTKIKDKCNLSTTTATTRIGEEVNTRYRAITSELGLITTRRGTITAASSIGNNMLTFTPCESIINVVDRSTTPYRVLQQVTVEELRQRQPSANNFAQYYAIFSQGYNSVTIMMDCVPAAIFTLYADVHQNLSTLSGSQVPVIPESFHDVLFWGVLYEELGKLQRPVDAKDAKLEYEDRLSKLRFFLAKSSYLENYHGKNRHGNLPTGVAGAGGGGGSAAIDISSVHGTASRLAAFDAGGVGISILLTNAYVDAAAAIAYSKLNLAGGIVNADINAAAAIVYSKLSIANGDITLAKIADGSALSVVGRSANSTGVHADIAAGTDGQVLRRTGTTLGFASAFQRLIDTSTGATNNWAISSLSGDAVILWNGASDISVTGIVAGYSGQMLIFRNITAAKVMTFAHNSGSSSAGNKFINLVLSGLTPVAPGGFALYVYDATNAVWYLVDHDQGMWITPPYAAGDFTGSGGTWTVDAGDVTAMRYRLCRRTLNVNFVLESTGPGATSNVLKIANGQWGGFTCASRTDSGQGFTIDNSAREAPGYIEVGAAGTFIGCVRYTAGNWTVAVNSAHVSGNTVFEVT